MNFNALVNHSNNTTTKLDLLPEIRTAELQAWMIVAFTLCIIGSFNNIVVLLITFPRPGRCKVAGLHTLIFHFICINLFLCLVDHPIRSGFVTAKYHGHIIQDSVCRYVHVFYNVGWIALSWADAALAVNRIIAMFFPHKYREWSSKSVNLVMVALPWLIGFALILPVSFGIVGGMTIQRLGQCGQSITNEAFQRLYVVATYTPHVIAGGGSLLIVWKAYFAARLRLNPSVNEWSEKTQRTLQRRLRMAKMLLLTFAWTMFCNVPYFVIVGQFAWLLDANPISGLWQQVASTSQYAFTPCILLLSNMEYRTRLLRILDKVKKRNQVESDGGSHQPQELTHR